MTAGRIPGEVRKEEIIAGVSERSDRYFNDSPIISHYFEVVVILKSHMMAFHGRLLALVVIFT